MKTFTIASNQGEVAGGEVMLLQLADAARDLGRSVTVVGPDSPSELCDLAAEQGHQVVRVPGAGPAAYLRGLRRWDRAHRRGMLWCNGLRPAFATAGRPGRVVHLHQSPTGANALLARVARRGALATVVPSRATARTVDSAVVLPNWSLPATARTPRSLGDPVVLGFLGRLSPDKGVDVLGVAVQELLRRTPGRYRLLLAGESRFVPAKEAAKVDAALAPLGDAVQRAGWMERQHFFDAVDLAVFPSVWQEAFGLVAGEAMAARVPFVVSDAGALPEVVGPDYPWTARRGDPSDLADVIERALAAPRDEIVERSYHRWLQHFSPDAGRAALAALLTQLDPEGGGS